MPDYQTNEMIITVQYLLNNRVFEYTKFKFRSLIYIYKVRFQDIQGNLRKGVTFFKSWIPMNIFYSTLYVLWLV